MIVCWTSSAPNNNIFYFVSFDVSAKPTHQMKQLSSNRSYAVATASTFFACGRVEETVYFRCCGGFAATTPAIDVNFLAAAGQSARCTATNTAIKKF
jgi:hypothetical protein